MPNLKTRRVGNRIGHRWFEIGSENNLYDIRERNRSRHGSDNNCCPNR